MKLLIDSDNNIVEIATKETEVHSSLTWVDTEETTAVVGDTFVNGEVVPRAVPEVTYNDIRRQTYLSVEDQLDQLYWDKKNGTNTWEEGIDAVKAAHPKPE